MIKSYKQLKQLRDAQNKDIVDQLPHVPYSAFGEDGSQIDADGALILTGGIYTPEEAAKLALFLYSFYVKETENDKTTDEAKSSYTDR